MYKYAMLVKLSIEPNSNLLLVELILVLVNFGEGIDFDPVGFNLLNDLLEDIHICRIKVDSHDTDLFTAGSC
jgi:hypothetical protein